MVHTFKAHNLEGRGWGKSLNSRPAWSTEWVRYPGHHGGGRGKRESVSYSSREPRFNSQMYIAPQKPSLTCCRRFNPLFWPLWVLHIWLRQDTHTNKNHYFLKRKKLLEECKTHQEVWVTVKNSYTYTYHISQQWDPWELKEMKICADTNTYIQMTAALLVEMSKNPKEPTKRQQLNCGALVPSTTALQ